MTEDILVFSKKQANYYPILIHRDKPKMYYHKPGKKSESYNIGKLDYNEMSEFTYPKNWLEFSTVNNNCYRRESSPDTKACSSA